MLMADTGTGTAAAAVNISSLVEKMRSTLRLLCADLSLTTINNFNSAVFFGAADPAANVAAFRAPDVRIATIKLTAWVTIDLVVDLDVDSFVFVFAADGKLQTILLGLVNKSSPVKMTDIIGILFFFVVLIVKVVVFFRLGVVIGRVKVVVFNFGVVVVIR